MSKPRLKERERLSQAEREEKRSWQREAPAMGKAEAKCERVSHRS